MMFRFAVLLAILSIVSAFVARPGMRTMTALNAGAPSFGVKSKSSSTTATKSAPAPAAKVRRRTIKSIGHIPFLT